MGCSSSAQTQVKDGSRPSPMAPGTNGLQKCDDNSPITDESETIPDQTKLGGMDEVDLASDGTKISENLTQENADVLLPEIAKCALSACQRVDPEGTEPPLVSLEEKFSRSEPLTTGLVEAMEKPQSVKLTEGDEPHPATEAASDRPPEITQDPKPELVIPTGGSTPDPLVMAEDFNLKTEMAMELQIEEEEPLTEEATNNEE